MKKNSLEWTFWTQTDLGLYLVAICAACNGRPAKRETTRSNAIAHVIYTSRTKNAT